MTSRFAVREHGVRSLALLAIAAVGVIAAVALPTTGAARSPAATVAVKKEDRRVSYGERVTVRGVLASRAPGRAVSVQYAPRGRTWRTVAQTSSRAGGRFAASLRARSSGRVRVLADGGASPTRPITVVARVRARLRAHLNRGSLAVVRGVVRPALAGRTVSVQLRRGAGWDTVDRARTRAGGRFKAVWRQRRPGRYAVRVVVAGNAVSAAAGRRIGVMYVYRPGHASWYGPGLYGNRTACGGSLGPGTLGVAHRTLPCGTKVTFRHRGRIVTVRVIDRGPFAAGREWDLTAATKRKLGFGSTGTVWAAH